MYVMNSIKSIAGDFKGKDLLARRHLSLLLYGMSMR